MVSPRVRFDAVGSETGIPHMANIVRLEVTRFMLRIRTRKTLAVLEELKDMASLEQLADAAANVLTKCLYHEIPSADPLDRADDCLEVALDLLQQRNFPLASLALTNADLTLDSYTKTPLRADHLRVIEGMRNQLKQMMGQLKQSSC
jgi:hypothetical protein